MIIKKNKIENNNVQNFQELAENSQLQAVEATEPAADVKSEPEINLFDLDNIDFKQRNERRKGDRRRGFRRIDDRNLISRAREEAESIRAAAQKEGYQDGLNQVKEDIEFFRDELEGFISAKKEIFEEIAPDILDISVEIAKKIIKSEITQNPEAILGNIKEILKDLSKEETKIMLKVNPSQAAFLKERVPEEVSAAGLEAKVMIIPDESITEGGCLFITTNGVIDATIDTQIEIIIKALKEV